MQIISICTISHVLYLSRFTCMHPKPPAHPDKTPTKYDWNFGIITRSNVITIHVVFTLMPNEIISATPDLIIHRMPEMTSLVTNTVVISTSNIRRPTLFSYSSWNWSSSFNLLIQFRFKLTTLNACALFIK